MLYVVIGTSAGRSREEVMAVFPRHKAFLDPFVARGENAYGLFAAERGVRGSPHLLVEQDRPADELLRALGGEEQLPVGAAAILGGGGAAVAVGGQLLTVATQAGGESGWMRSWAELLLVGHVEDSHGREGEPAAGGAAAGSPLPRCCRWRRRACG